MLSGDGGGWQYIVSIVYSSCIGLLSATVWDNIVLTFCSVPFYGMVKSFYCQSVSFSFRSKWLWKATIKHSPKGLVRICSVWDTTVYSSDSTAQNHVSHLIIRNGLIQQVPRVDIG